MAVAKEIRSKISSIKSTQKITRAMELVAASKMRKAQDLMAASRPYAEKIQQVVSHLASAHAEYKHLYLESRPLKKAGFIVVASDRGLCGGLNLNLFKKALETSKALSEDKVGINFCLVGNKAISFFQSIGGDVTAAIRGLGDKPSATDLVGMVKVMLDQYEDQTIDRLYLIHNRFINTMIQEPRVQQLLPLSPAEEDTTKRGHHWDYIYEPEAKSLLDLLMARFIESQVYQAVVENNACEQAARMVAMKAATDNAGGLIDELQLVYNKARQAAITQELSEIVSGAAAV